MKVLSNIISSIIFKASCVLLDNLFNTKFQACVFVITVGAIHTFIATDEVSNDVSDKESKKDTTKGDLVFTLAQVAALPPHVHINQTCFPPPLPRYPACKGETGLTGMRLDKPRKVVLMILFGFEVDTLEIALMEQMDLLDKIFIVESTFTNKGVIWLKKSIPT